MRVDTDRYNRAWEFAKAAHGDQKRKYTGEPYWTHLVRVAEMVADTHGCTMEMVEAALLHDVLEDTHVTEYTLRTMFSPLVAHYVLELTDPDLSFGNRAARKAATVERLRDAPVAVKTIKLADLLDNGPSIKEHDPKFYKVFLAEKTKLIEALKGGDPILYERAMAMTLQISARGIDNAPG